MTFHVSKLVSQLEAACAAYYNDGESSMSDAEYDVAVDQLRAAEPNHPFLLKVGADFTEDGFPHDSPVGSQEKIKTEDEFNRWCDKVEALHDPSVGPTYVIQWKLDGLTVVLYYEDGQIKRALTRGTGLRGEDITRNVSMMSNVAKQVPGFTGSLRGEALMTISDYDTHFKPLGHRNPRNTAAGKAREFKAPANLLKHIGVKWFDAVNGKTFATEMARQAFFKTFGLVSVETWHINDRKALWAKYQELEAARPNLPYEVDGVIVRANSIAVQDKLGMSGDFRPKGQRCIKFEAVSKTTYLREVEITIGTTGAHVPTGKVDPVEIGGVTVSSVFLNNWDDIKRLGIAVGDKVEIIRAGDVIPKIVRVLERPAGRKAIPMPTKCIHCDEKLVKEGAHVECLNVECTGREFRRLKSWVKKRKIKFLGVELLKVLYDRGLATKPHHLYGLMVETLAALPRGNGVVGGAAGQIIKEIEKSRNCPLNELLGSLGVKFLGRRAAQIMSETCGLTTLDQFLTVKADELREMPGFSATGSKAEAIVDGIAWARPEIALLLNELNVIEPKAKPAAPSGGPMSKVSGKSFCFSGALPSGMKRDEAQSLAVGAGGSIKSSVSKNLDFLVIADPSSTSGKAKKARSLGVEIISESTFQEML